MDEPEKRMECLRLAVSLQDTITWDVQSDADDEENAIVTLARNFENYINGKALEKDSPLTTKYKQI